MGARPSKLAESAQEPLPASDERLRSIVENVVDGIITIDESGIIQTANAAAERIFGYNNTELIGRNVASLMPEPYTRVMTPSWPIIWAVDRPRSSASAGRSLACVAMGRRFLSTCPSANSA